MNTILVLEDNDERIAAFQQAVEALGDGFDLKVWREAPSMIAECETFFPTAALISLDHDLNPMPGATADPGTGVDVARFLGDFMPVCPVLIHSSNTDRGYGSMTRIQMREITAGAKWRATAANAFGGQGSMGNGSAMRVAPLGACFADDLERCAADAKASSLVTHTHPEGVAGAVAVALAAATAWQLRANNDADRARAFFEAVLNHTPESQVLRGLVLASTTPPDIPAADVARTLGNGSQVTAPDTVPFCLWMAAHHLDRFVEALGKTVSVGGDCDTNAAIVGGIVALSAGRDSIPAEWLKAREPIQI